MVSVGTVNRLVATSQDFDTTGLQIIGYYLKLYAIELLLSDQERSVELTELATELLTTVETYKESVKSADASELGNPVYGLIHDQEKAKMYVSNFALSLYNGKLKQIQEGPWDYALQRGLWCCIDLFSCISHLWGDQDGSVKRRLKYCKVYLSKLVKGKLGPNNEVEQDSLETTPGAKLDYKDFLDNEPEESVSEMVSRLRTADDEEEEEQKGKGDGATISLPQAPNNEPASKVESEFEPAFIDSDEDEEKDSPAIAVAPAPAPALEPAPLPAPALAPATVETQSRYTKDQLTTMLERSEEIEKVQRMAKYAISALNYDDISTAKDELTKALEILNLL